MLISEFRMSCQNSPTTERTRLQVQHGFEFVEQRATSDKRKKPVIERYHKMSKLGVLAQMQMIAPPEILNRDGFFTVSYPQTIT